MIQCPASNEPVKLVVVFKHLPDLYTYTGRSAFMYWLITQNKYQFSYWVQQKAWEMMLHEQVRSRTKFKEIRSNIIRMELPRKQVCLQTLLCAYGLISLLTLNCGTSLILNCISSSSSFGTIIVPVNTRPSFRIIAILRFV